MTTKPKIFGTDGIRGKANLYPMTPEVALHVGKAVAAVLRRKRASGRGKPKIVLGKDTRLSGYLLETALTSGIVSNGCHCFLVGPLPTPAIAHLAKSMNADAGIVISASHNPAEDNGIKIFAGNGYKLNDGLEQKIEQLVFSSKPIGNGSVIGKAFRIDDAKGRYIEFCKASIGSESLEGLKIVLDCANGAAYHIAPYIFSELGADVISLNVSPDGSNINRGCGATSPQSMQAAVRREKADIGFAFDGDADRVIVADHLGNVVDGDHVLAMAALDLQERGKLIKDTVVATVMSNAGFHEAMQKAGINVKVTAVGDKYVIDEMRAHGYALGGEQSGHIVFADYGTTGDGIITALQLLRILKRKGKRLAQLARCMTTYPQVLLNLPVKAKKPLERLKATRAAIASAEASLAGGGRVLVRYSGTENLARVMVEAKTKAAAQKHAKAIAAALKKEVS